MRNSVGQIEIAAIFEEFDPLRLSAVHRLGLGESSRLIPQNLIRQDGGATPNSADAFRVFVATLILIPPAIAGARLLYVAAHWDEYRNQRERIWNRQEGGMAMYGGMPIMLLLSVPLLAALGLGFGAFWDVASLTIMTGMIFTKIGCLLNGCCAGAPSRSRIALVLPGLRGVWEQRIPVQLLESGWAAVVLAAAILLLGRLPFGGALFLVVASLYAGGRLGLEFWRERDPAAGRISSGSAVSVLTVISAIAILAIRWPR